METKSLFSLILKALFPRLLFFFHGMVCIWLLVKQENNTTYWYLTLCLGVLVLEGIFNAVVRHGKEFHWICPSAFLYCAVLIVTMVVLREGQLECIKLNLKTPPEKRMCPKDILNGTDHITNVINGWRTTHVKRTSMIEQTGLLVLIVGRWLLPQGSISRDQFSKIILIYVGTAADIVEFSEIYGEEDLGAKLQDQLSNVLRGLMAVWIISVLQFSMTVALPEDGLKEEEKEEEEEDVFEERSYFRGKMQTRVAPKSYMHYKTMLLNMQSDTMETNNNIQQVLPMTAEEDDEVINVNNNNINKHSMSVGINNTSNFQRSQSIEELLPPKYNKPFLSSRQRKQFTPNTISINVEGKAKGSNKLSKNVEKVSKKKTQNSVKSKVSKSKKENENEVDENNNVDISKKDVKTCFVNHINLIRILIPVCMQDGPFFIARFVLVAHYEIITEMIFLLIVKNGLVIILHIYRILLLYCSEPEENTEMESESARVRTILNSKNHK